MKKLFLSILFLLPVSGLLAACVDLPGDLGLGDGEGPVQQLAVKQLQTFLNEKVSVTAPTLGFYSRLTTKIVKDFQTANSLPVTGRADSATRAKIKSLTCSDVASLPVTACPANYTPGYVATGGNDNATGVDVSSPVKTLTRARNIAAGLAKPCILLKGGDVFTNFPGEQHPAETSANSRYAFIWKINKPLVMTSYGFGRAILRSLGVAPSALLLVGNKTRHFTAPVEIKNLQFEKWQARVISISGWSGVKVLDNVVDSVGTKYLGDGGTANNADGPRIYGDGVFYPKDSDHLLFDGNVMRNMVNNTGGKDNKYDDIHAFYLTRVTDVEISNNLIENCSGPMIKPSKGSSNIDIHNNKLIGSGPYQGQSSYDQLGFVRLDGDSGCPSGIVIANNEMSYPYCVGSSCAGKIAPRCSQVKCSGFCSNPASVATRTVNGGRVSDYKNYAKNYGDDPGTVLWQDNVFNPAR
ncbi:MAG: peptidoglycan-binding domain-containing protein [Candidatus Vogelbacteria bacterium]|nr:peptidoglycan-binding domain-containing protein [Candidatus Vogelbacteria bacterium]